MDAGHVLVIGASGLDIKGRAAAPLQQATSNPGTVRTSFGGVARNISENLARLEIDTILLTVVGDDSYGDLIMAQAATAGVNVTHVLQVEGKHSGSYLAVLNEDGDLAVAVSDYSIMAHLDENFLRDHESLFTEARMVVMDLNLSTAAIDKTLELASQHDVPVCVDPTSPAHAHKIKPYLHRLHLVTPNLAEVTELCEGYEASDEPDIAINAAKQLVATGTHIAIVTLGDKGVVYADVGTSGHIHAIKAPIVDTTGAGDALSAAVIFGLLNEISLEETMRLGVTAATLTLRSRESVVPELTADLLYDHLIA